MNWLSTPTLRSRMRDHVRKLSTLVSSEFTAVVREKGREREREREREKERERERDQPELETRYGMLWSDALHVRSHQKDPMAPAHSLIGYLLITIMTVS